VPLSQSLPHVVLLTSGRAVLVEEGLLHTHVKHILEKLNASDRTEAVIIALRRGLIRL